MHTKEELDRAVVDLYKDYKDAIKDCQNRNIKFAYDITKITNDEQKYTKQEVYYIGMNALALLIQDIKKIDR